MSFGARGVPLPELHGEALVRELLTDIEEDERLGVAVGVDLTPPSPSPSHFSAAPATLLEWLQRAEEVARLLELAYRAERARQGR